MKTSLAAILAGMSVALSALCGTAVAEEHQTCEIPAYLRFANNDLKHVAEVVKKDRRLTIADRGVNILH